MITPRETLLLRAPTLAAFQRAIAARVADARLGLEGGEPAVLVPTRAAADQLRRTLRGLGADAGGGVRRPAIVPRSEWYDWLQARAASPVRLLTLVEREVLGSLAARDAAAAGAPPPFRLRPGIVAALLAFYDDLRRRQKTVDTFERLLIEDLEPSADIDRGARRLLEQTRFLIAAFRAYEQRLDAAPGIDEHRFRDHLRETGTREPVPEVVVTVADEVANPAGLYPADFDLLARLPGLARVTIVATDSLLDSGFRQRLDDVLPEIGEVRVAPDPAPPPRLVVPGDTAGDSAYFTCRDREEELRGVARAVSGARVDAPGLSAAVVVARPLPYLYLAPPIFTGAGLRTRAGDGLPLAVEPYAAAVHLVLQYAAGDRSATTMSLFRNPQFAFAGDEAAGIADQELAPLGASRPLAHHLATLRAFLQRHAARLPDPRDAIAERTARARALIHDGLEALETAHRALNDGGASVSLAELATTVRRWIESRTYPPDRSVPRDGDVHLIDPDTAPYGRFDHLFIAGLIEAEWPRRAERNIFYPVGMLASLGWPAERDRLRAARALFNDLLCLPRARVQLSAFLLEDDTAVTVSPMLEDLDLGALDRIAAPATKEEDSQAPPDAAAAAERWRAFRLARAATGTARDRLRGDIGPQPSRPYAVGALERYLDCPFKYFARHVLRLKEEDDEEQTMTRGALLRRVDGVRRAGVDRPPLRRDGRRRRVDDGQHVASGEAEHGAPLLVRVRDGVHLGPRLVYLRVQRPRADASRITLACLDDIAVEVDEHEVVRLDALEADGGRRADEDEVGVRHARADVSLVGAEAVVVQQTVRESDLLMKGFGLGVVRHGVADANTGGKWGSRSLGGGSAALLCMSTPRALSARLLVTVRVEEAHPIRHCLENRAQQR